MSKITRAQALREMEIKEDPDGNQRTFSILFEKKDGQLVFLPKAVTSGLRYNMSQKRFRAVIKVDHDMQAVGHVYPVHIDNIHRFNNHTLKM